MGFASKEVSKESELLPRRPLNKKAFGISSLSVIPLNIYFAIVPNNTNQIEGVLLVSVAPTHGNKVFLHGIFL